MSAERNTYENTNPKTHDVTKFISLTKLFNTTGFWQNGAIKIECILWRTGRTFPPSNRDNNQ